MSQAEKQGQLWELCAQFIDDHNIYHPEVVYLNKRVGDNLYNLVKRICDIVGYVDPPEEE